MKYLKICFLIAIVTIFYSSTSQSEVSSSTYTSFNLVSDLASKWPSTTIPVCWENPTNANARGRAWTKEAVYETWVRHSSLNFTGWSKCIRISRGIRILIDDDVPHTKGLGNQLDGTRNGMVLNFTFHKWGRSCSKSLKDCIKVIAVHEFGHALGFAHEQNRSDAPKECQKERQGPDGDTDLTKYDLHSVMNYCNPKWSGDGKLSQKDIKGLQKWYGSSLLANTLSVHLQAYNGQYVMAEGGGGGAVNANRDWTRTWETFTIRKVGGTGQINCGDKISLQAHNGNYVVAEGGGGGVVNANRSWVRSWETFKIKCAP